MRRFILTRIIHKFRQNGIMSLILLAKSRLAQIHSVNYQQWSNKFLLLKFAHNIAGDSDPPERKGTTPCFKTRIIRVKILLVLTFAAPAGRAAADPAVTFEEANRKYLAEDYDGAKEDYLSLAEEYESASLYYNLGNAFAALGDAGRAVLWFERAKRLNPGGDDIDFNLRVLRDKIARIGAAEVVAENPQIFTGVAKFFGSFPYRPIRNIFLLIYFLFSALLLYFTIRGSTRKIVKISLVAFGVLSLISGSVFAGKIVHLESDRRAVILDEAAAATEGPDEDLKELFTVPEGWVVEIMEVRPAWRLVKLPNGLTGWIPESKLGEI